MIGALAMSQLLMVVALMLLHYHNLCLWLVRCYSFG